MARAAFTKQRARAAMLNRYSLSSIPKAYDAFLYAPVFVEENGTGVSVLSAIARRNADPWDEAARLAAMPKAAAAKTLALTLDLIHNKNWNTGESETIAGRLVSLLPGADAVISAKASSEPVPAGSKQSAYWFVCLYIAMSLSYIWSSHKHDRSPAFPAETASTVHTELAEPPSSK